MTALLIFIVSVLLSTGFVALILKLSHSKGWYDHVNSRKVHTGSIPRLGGIGFALAFFVITTAIGIAYGISGVNIFRYLPCAAAMIIALVSGAYDDFRPMLPRNKFILQLIAAICVVMAGFDFERLLYFGGGYLTNLNWLKYPITILWIIGISNAVNLIDGIDGLAGGISAIIAFFLALIFFSFAGVSKSVLLCISLFGVLIGFLIFNLPFPKAKIFMGDSGSQFLGLTLALLPLMKENNNHSSLPVLYVAALFAIPIFDTTAAVWRRLRDKRKISDPDKSHLHHKLLHLNLSVPKVLAVLYILQIIIGILIFASVRISISADKIISLDNNIFSLIILGAAYFIIIAFFITIHFLNRANKKKNPSLYANNAET